VQYFARGCISTVHFSSTCDTFARENMVLWWCNSDFFLRRRNNLYSALDLTNMGLLMINRKTGQYLSHKQRNVCSSGSLFFIPHEPSVDVRCLHEPLSFRDTTSFQIFLCYIACCVSWCVLKDLIKAARADNFCYKFVNASS